MSDTARRSTIYFDPDIYQALRIKSATTQRSVTELVNEAVRQSLREDQEDLEAFEQRVAEPAISYEALLKDLKKHGKL